MRLKISAIIVDDRRDQVMYTISCCYYVAVGIKVFVLLNNMRKKMNRISDTSEQLQGVTYIIIVNVIFSMRSL